MKFPAHKCGLFLTHNEHRDYYETADEWNANNLEKDDWVSPEQELKALKEDSIWVLQWYPDTPVGFKKLAAADLDVLLEAAKDA